MNISTLSLSVSFSWNSQSLYFEFFSLSLTFWTHSLLSLFLSQLPPSTDPSKYTKPTTLSPVHTHLHRHLHPTPSLYLSLSHTHTQPPSRATTDIADHRRPSSLPSPDHHPITPLSFWLLENSLKPVEVFPNICAGVFDLGLLRWIF